MRLRRREPAAEFAVNQLEEGMAVASVTASGKLQSLRKHCALDHYCRTCAVHV